MRLGGKRMGSSDALKPYSRNCVDRVGKNTTRPHRGTIRPGPRQKERPTMMLHWRAEAASKATTRSPSSRICRLSSVVGAHVGYRTTPKAPRRHGYASLG